MENGFDFWGFVGVLGDYIGMHRGFIEIKCIEILLLIVLIGIYRWIQEQEK